MLKRIEKSLKQIFLKIFKIFIPQSKLKPETINHNDIKKILVIFRHRMGDMVCTFPMINSLRKFYPGSKIILLTNSSSRYNELFNDTGYADIVKYYDKGIENFFYIIKEIKDMGIDMAIVPSPVAFSATNHLAAYLSGAKYRVGVRSRDYEKNPAEYLLNIKSDFLWDIKKVHQIERNLDVIRQAGTDVTEKRIKLNLPYEAFVFAEEFYAKNFPDSRRKVIGFHPGARKDANVWPSENFAELIFLMNERFNPYFYISEGPEDEVYISRLEKIIKEKNINYTKYKGELINNLAVISKLSLFITNDTGIMHLASGLKTPQIALFGETYAWQWGPLGEKKVSIQSGNGKIKNITPDVVYETCLTLL
ncbi:MAG: glycosyltransferase family 9 protein [Ignavibacteria bacterium]|nr:glycosyltransferase family 9 protein [Ignavibacteria bacterium]